MRLSRILSAAIASLLPCVAVSAAVDELPAQNKRLQPAQAGRVSDIDVKHVSIDLRFDRKLKQAHGTSEITLSPVTAVHSIALDGAFLTINRISLRAGASLTYAYDGSPRDGALVITLDRTYQPGEVLTVSIDYHTNWQNRSDPNNIWGSFGKGLRFFEPTTTVPTKRLQIWSMGEPESNRYWFPSYDAPNDLRTTDFTATVEKPLVVISNGELLATKEHSNGTRGFHWRMNTPYPNYLTSVVVGNYQEVRQRAGSVALHTYAYPDEYAAAVATVVRLPAMLKYYSSLTGKAYPWSRYSQVMVQDFPGGMAHTMAATITDNMIDDFRTHADFYYLWDLQESQMVAGQWFGSLISPKYWQDIWLSHAFAHYLDEMFNEQHNGRDEFLLYQLLADQATYLGDWQSNVRHPVVTPHYESADSFTSDNYSLARGALVLHMLRKHLGEEKWRRVIKRYVAANAGKQVVTADFQAAVDAEAGESMAWFFDQWVFKMGHPIFKVSKHYDPVERALRLDVSQTQKIDPNDPYPQTAFFKGRLDVAIDGRIRTLQIEPQAEQSFTFVSAKSPQLVNFDVESTWIKELTFDQSLNELLYQFQHDSDVTGRNAAMQKLVLHAKDTQTLPADRSRIYAAFRSVVSSKVYWRLRANALAQLRGLLAPGPKAAMLDLQTRTLLQRIARQDVPWLRTGAVRFLGMTRDPAYVDLYLAALSDQSDRVVNAAAIALGQSMSPKAYAALVKLIQKPSWKSQSLISALNGFRELGDPRAARIALDALADTQLPRWWLATPVWDHRLSAVDTLVALERAGDAFPMLFNRFNAALRESDDNDIFGNMQLLANLGDPRGREAISMLKLRFKDDANAMTAVMQYEAQLESTIKPAP